MIGLIRRRLVLRCYSKTASGNASPSGSGGFFKKFAENIKKDQAKDEELKDSVRKFEEKLTELNELEGIKRAKEILSKAKEETLKQNEQLVSEVKETVQNIRDVTGKISSKVGETVSTATKPIKDLGEAVKPYMPNISESELAQKIGKTVSSAEESLLENTNAYKYGGFKDREARERSKARRQQAQGEEPEIVPEENLTKENPEAGESVVLHKTSRLSKLWSDFKDDNPVFKRIHNIKQRYDESNNMFVFFMREFTGSITDRFASLFAETETAKAMKEIAARDPSFNLEAFMKDAHEVIIPEILDALVTADLPTLRIWCSEGTFNILKANFEAQLKAGHQMEGRILDLRHIEVATAKLIDDTPVIVLTFNTQQISYVRDAATGQIVEGKPDGIEMVHYVMALAKEEMTPAVAKSHTKGWKLLEIAIRPGGGF